MTSRGYMQLGKMQQLLYDRVPASSSWIYVEQGLLAGRLFCSYEGRKACP